MIMKIIFSKPFQKKYKRIIDKNPLSIKKINQTLILLERNMFDKSLEIHKLTGKLYGHWASSCGKDCRIVFRIINSIYNNEPVILLIDIGTHDEVY